MKQKQIYRIVFIIGDDIVEYKEFLLSKKALLSYMKGIVATFKARGYDITLPNIYPWDMVRGIEGWITVKHEYWISKDNKGFFLGYIHYNALNI